MPSTEGLPHFVWYIALERMVEGYAILGDRTASLIVLSAKVNSESQTGSVATRNVQAPDRQYCSGS